jgi:hypothetical protein
MRYSRNNSLPSSMFLVLGQPSAFWNMNFGSDVVDTHPRCFSCSQSGSLLDELQRSKGNPEWYFSLEKRVNWRRVWKVAFTSWYTTACSSTLYKVKIVVRSFYSKVWNNSLESPRDTSPGDITFTPNHHHTATPTRRVYINTYLITLNFFPSPHTSFISIIQPLIQ